ncbi:MAG: 3-oxoacid CoA-transferase subunit A [Chloroflexi bacterium]|nr:3-oxoacid CoA-transferase subunit A [Chloroflexota bacterium]MYD48466.1 3-oxoacid CoA-transferase subunit A [Chloroflexota bacterium]
MTFTKLYDTAAAAVADVHNGATVLIGGVSRTGEPTALLAALHSHGAAGLTIVCDFSGWDGSDSIVKLAADGRIARIISPNPYPSASGDNLREVWNSAGVAIESVPQGTLAERLRAAGAGIGGVFVPVGLGTRFADGRETRTINGVECILESPLRADFALVRAASADTLGNLAYQGAQRGWNAVMATAARITITQADTVGEPGAIGPELVITPGIYVNRVVHIPPTGEQG